MPELPEVHGYQQYINATILHKKIVHMECRDDRLLKMTLQTFRNHLIDQEFTGTERIGKYLFLKTSGDRVLVMHFGMTGRPNYFHDVDDRPKFGHIMLAFNNDYHFAFENKRKFGWWDLTENIEEYRKEHDLSKDARELTLEEFKESLEGRKTSIKNILMNQSICAGIGNWMADDILYQAQMHPEIKVSNLDNDQTEKVFDKMQHVIEVAIENDAHYSDFPDYFLIHNRKEDATCHHTGDKIKKIKVGGRSTYFCPSWQEK
ncbi:MAG: DNA-formamidopyrimidine glycosylase family protein [Nonlabens sp.]